MIKTLSILIVALTLLSAPAFAADTAAQTPLTEQQAVELLQQGKAIYSCPMHAHVFSDKEGPCPICGMDLTQAKAIEKGEAVFSDAKPMPMMESK